MPVAEAGDSVAVKVTDWAESEGFAEEASATVEGAEATYCVMGLELAPW